MGECVAESGSKKPFYLVMLSLRRSGIVWNDDGFNRLRSEIKMNTMRYNKDFIAEMLAENSLLTTGSRAQNAPPAILPMMVAAPRPRLRLDVDDATLQSDGYGMGTVIGVKL